MPVSFSHVNYLILILFIFGSKSPRFTRAVFLTARILGCYYGSIRSFQGPLMLFSSIHGSCMIFLVDLMFSKHDETTRHLCSMMGRYSQDTIFNVF